jgi:copper chaperone CopZ
MRFANLRQIVGLTLAWALVLFTADYIKHPRPIAQLLGRAPSGAGPMARPHLRIWMKHLCCSGCLADVQQALAELPGLGPAALATPEIRSPAQASAAPAAIDDDSNRLEIDVTDVKLLDFVVVDHAIEQTGLAAERMEFGGVPHFRIEAELKHLCCQACVKGLEMGLSITRSLRATGQFGWIDSVAVSKEHRRLIIHARYDRTVDLEELMAALHHIGFSPASLRVLTGPET